MDKITFGVLTVSDTCASGHKQDTSGPTLVKLIKEWFPNNSEVIATKIVADDIKSIEDILITWSDQLCNVILTTGGTGFSPRDVTPEATRAVINKEAPAISTAITVKSLNKTPMAMLSRGICGIRNKTIIINFPGSAKGSAECFEFVKDVLKHAVDLVLDNGQNIKRTHDGIQITDASKVKINCAAQRNRHSPYPMIEVTVAQEIIQNLMTNKGAIEEVDINDCLNRVLAEDVYSRDPLPPFPASIKDGYAVIASDGAGVRSVRDSVAAGDKPSNEALKPGEIVRISTGAPIPAGADAVVQVEDTELIEHSSDWSKEIKVEIKVTPKVGLDIRPTGSDIPDNCKILESNMRLSSGHIGILAALGQTKIKVFRQLTIGVTSTGNELQNPHELLKPGHIRDSNKLALINLLKQYSYRANDCGIAGDKPDDVKRALIAGFAQHDVLITTGGVSMGEFDVVKQVLIMDFGAKIHFGRVNMKPGKPTTFATCIFNGREKFVFALPGNPVSATVTTILFVIPGLQKYENLPKDEYNTTSVYLGEDIPLDPRPEYMRAYIDRVNEDGKYVVKPTGNQISSRLNSFVGAQFLLIIPGKTTQLSTLASGTAVNAIRIY